MEYKIRGTEEYMHESDDIFYYIENKLKAPMAANRLRQEIKDNILLLKKAPRLFEKVKICKRLERQYRRIVIKNYVIIYTIDEINKIVYILHMYYGKRNYIDNLL